MIGEGPFGAIFVPKYTQNKDIDSRTVESVIVKKLLGSSLNFINAFTKEADLINMNIDTLLLDVYTNRVWKGGDPDHPESQASFS